jgi:hypothetical protein
LFSKLVCPAGKRWRCFITAAMGEGDDCTIVARPAGSTGHLDDALDQGEHGLDQQR